MFVAGSGLTGTSARADQMTSAGAKPVIVMAGKEKWAPMAGTKGVQISQVYGDMSKPGPYVIRLLCDAGVKFGPHTHPGAEQVTVLTGTLSVGVGRKMDASKMIDLAPGSFVFVPANLAHYASAKTKTEIELHGTGPFAMVMVK